MFNTPVMEFKENNFVISDFILYQNYPNPFSTKTTISYQLTEYSRVILKVFDMIGREIQTLIDKEQHPGFYEFEFDGSKLNTGTYLYRLNAGNTIYIKKMVRIKYDNI